MMPRLYFVMERQMGRYKARDTALKSGDYVMVMYIGICKVKQVDSDGLATLEKGSFWGGTVEFKEYVSRCIKLKGIKKHILRAMYIGKNLKYL
jgi:hypothetical protein